MQFEFQCSSASRKFLNDDVRRQYDQQRQRFSALQRAENFSITNGLTVLFPVPCFSALQRAENFSMDRRRVVVADHHRVSVLFSEPKISQSSTPGAPPPAAGVSVLFSEPKISQSAARVAADSARASFSALQRAENFSIQIGYGALELTDEVSVLFSEPKISQ